MKFSGRTKSIDHNPEILIIWLGEAGLSNPTGDWLMKNWRKPIFCCCRLLCRSCWCDENDYYLFLWLIRKMDWIQIEQSNNMFRCGLRCDFIYLFVGHGGYFNQLWRRKIHFRLSIFYSSQHCFKPCGKFRFESIGINLWSSTIRRRRIYIWRERKTAKYFKFRSFHPIYYHYHWGYPGQKCFPN